MSSKNSIENILTSSNSYILTGSNSYTQELNDLLNNNPMLNIIRYNYIPDGLNIVMNLSEETRRQALNDINILSYILGIDKNDLAGYLQLSEQLSNIKGVNKKPSMFVYYNDYFLCSPNIINNDSFTVDSKISISSNKLFLLISWDYFIKLVDDSINGLNSDFSLSQNNYALIISYIIKNNCLTIIKYLNSIKEYNKYRLMIIKGILGIALRHINVYILSLNDFIEDLLEKFKKIINYFVDNKQITYNNTMIENSINNIINIGDSTDILKNIFNNNLSYYNNLNIDKRNIIKNFLERIINYISLNKLNKINFYHVDTFINDDIIDNLNILTQNVDNLDTLETAARNTINNTDYISLYNILFCLYYIN